MFFLMRMESLNALLACIHTRKKFNSGTPDQFCIADRLRPPRSIIIEVPVRPSPVCILVVHQLEQVLWNTYLSRTDAGTLRNAWFINRASDDINVPRSPRSIFTCCSFYRLRPDAPVVFWRLWNNIRKLEALSHCLRSRHIPCWC